MPSTTEVPVLPTGPRVNPYPMYAGMRRDGAVHRVREPNGLERWLIVRYAEARAAFTDDRLSKDPRRAWDQLRAAGYVKGDPGDRADYVFHLANTDPPDHTRLRKLISKAFTGRRIEAMRPRTEQIAADLLDRLPVPGPADLIAAYAHPLPLTVICEMLGVPPTDGKDFRTWATAMLTAPDAVTTDTMSPQEGYAAMRGYFVELLQRKRAELRGTDVAAQPDVLSALIVTRDEGNQLTEVEMVALGMLLLSAGQEPTVNLITNGVYALTQHPDQLQLLRDQPELIGSAVAEFLRYDGPVELSTMRVAIEDIEIAGTVIPAGSVVTVALAATDRDPDRFAEPDRLDLTRPDNAHLAFGHGLHHCLGAPLARLQAEIAIGALIRRFPDLALGCDPDELRWRPTRIMRGLVELPIRFGPPS